MSEHEGKEIEFDNYAFWFNETDSQWECREGGYVCYVAESSVGDRFISHLLTRAVTAERERDEARVEVARLQEQAKHSDDVFKRVSEQTRMGRAERDDLRFKVAELEAELNALRAQLESSTVQLEFTAEEREKAHSAYSNTPTAYAGIRVDAAIDALCAGRRVAREAEVEELRAKVAALESRRLSAPMPTREEVAKVISLALNGDPGTLWCEEVASAVDAVLALLPAQKPVARELTMEEVEKAYEACRSKRIKPGTTTEWECIRQGTREEITNTVNACIAHACTVAKPVAPEQPAPIQTSPFPPDAHGKPTQPAPDREKAPQQYAKQIGPYMWEREKVIKLAREIRISRDYDAAICISNAEKFLAAADAYRKGRSE